MRKNIIITLIFLSLAVVQTFAQKRAITGTVVDDLEDVGLIGATITETGTTNATMADLDGKFELSVSDQAKTLTVQYIGYVTQEVKLTGAKDYSIKLEMETKALKDVVVVGYGVQAKASVVGAIAQVAGSDLEKVATPNLTNTLAGRASGVITVMGSGKPGDDDTKIYIRGQASPNSSSPLVLVDGVERDWKEVDSNDVESMSVLKDASATAVYGVRGGNGVILITTKRGKKGKPVFKFSSQTAFKQAIRLPEYLRSYDYATLYNEATWNDNKLGTSYIAPYSEADLEHYRTGDSPYTHPDNDYYKDFLKKSALQQMFNLSARGGTDFVTYYISGNFVTQEGLYRTFENENYPTNNRYTRFNLRSNLDFQVTKTTKVSVDMTGRLETRNQANNGSAIFDRIQKMAPNWQPYINPDGSLNNNTRDQFNPVVMISKLGYRWNYKNVFEGSFTLDQKLDAITKGLNFKFLGSIRNNFTSQQTISDEPDAWRYDKNGRYFADELKRTDISYSQSKGPSERRFDFQASLNYSRTFNDHTVGGLILYYQDRKEKEFDIPISSLGWAGRATYAFKQRYLFEVNMGYNGSTKFSKEKRYAWFPAVSVGWVMSDEGFWKDNVKFADFFKIRASYGETGYDDASNTDYSTYYKQEYYETPGGDGNQIYWGEIAGGKEKGIVEGKLGNDFVGWERAKKTNIGFDTKMFKSRFSLSFDLFQEKRVDIIGVSYSIPLILGMGSPSDSKRGLPPENINEVLNRGFEIEAGYNGKVKDFSYYVKGNFSLARNKFTKIDEQNIVYEWQSKLNRPIGQIFGLTDIGLYQYDDFVLNPDGSLFLRNGDPVLVDGLPIPQFGAVYPGDCKYADLNGDGEIDVYDRGAIGKTKVPEYTFGVTLGGDFKGFDFSMLFQGAGGANMPLKEYAVWEFFTSKNGNGKVMKHHLDRYIPEDPSTWNTASYPRLHAGTNDNNHQSSTRWLYDRSYVRLKNMEIGYTLPAKIAQKIFMSGCRIFVSGDNLITWDNMMSWDPESSSESGSAYPQMRTWNAGINITF